ncbi:MAG: hypothetical protein V3W34_16020 [Phycisphaerae bacterium]
MLINRALQYSPGSVVCGSIPDLFVLFAVLGVLVAGGCIRRTTDNGSDNGSDNGPENGSENVPDGGSDNGSGDGPDNGSDNSGFQEGRYAGPGSCFRFFEAPNRAPVVDVVDARFELEINADGSPVRDGVEIEAGTEIGFTAGVFEIKRTVLDVAVTGGSILIGFAARAAIDEGDDSILELSGTSTDFFESQEDGGLTVSTAVNLTAVDPERGFVQLAFDCEAELSMVETVEESVGP